MQAQGPAHRDPRQDRQGLRPGQGRRGPDGRAPAEEARRRGAARAARPLQHPGLRRRHRQACRSASRADDSEEMRYLHERAQGARRLPAGSASRTRAPLAVPELEAFQSMLEGTGEREISTTMAFVRILSVLLKDKNIGKHIVPIVPDEARTFGMEGLFRQIGIYSSVGQLYTPQDADQLMSYREDKKGQMLEEGINEAGALCSWIAAATAYANHGMHDGAVLHLLLDVRLPARRRLHLGRRRHAGARLPAGRHRRPHHARRRGPAAPGRPQPAARDHGAELPRLRSGLRLRARRDHPGRPAAHVRRRRRRLLLHHA